VVEHHVLEVAFDIDRIAHVADGVKAAPDAQVAHDHVSGRNAQRPASDTDAFTRRGLSGDGEIRLGDGQRPLAFVRGGEIDGAGDGEHDDAVGLADRVGEAARSAKVEVGDAVDGSGASPRGECARAFGAGKGGKLCRRRRAESHREHCHACHFLHGHDTLRIGLACGIGCP
jgi:hypothetical protein